MFLHCCRRVSPEKNRNRRPNSALPPAGQPTSFGAGTGQSARRERKRPMATKRLAGAVLMLAICFATVSALAQTPPAEGTATPPAATAPAEAAPAAAPAPAAAAAPAAAPAPAAGDLAQRVADLEAYVTNGAPKNLTTTSGPGHNAWMMTSSALVLFMTLPGLALFYGGLVRRKNVLSVMAQCLGCAGMVTVLWWACG